MTISVLVSLWAYIFNPTYHFIDFLKNLKPNLWEMIMIGYHFRHSTKIEVETRKLKEITGKNSTEVEASLLPDEAEIGAEAKTDQNITQCQIFLALTIFSNLYCLIPTLL
jgi:hypothetical protein